MSSTKVKACLITGQKVNNLDSDNGWDGIYYELSINDHNYRLKFPWDAQSWFINKPNAPFNLEDQQKLREKLENGEWRLIDSVINISNLRELLKEKK